VMQIRHPDVIDDHAGVVLRAPGLDVGVVEPGVVPRYEVLPLQDLQRLLLGLNLARPGTMILAPTPATRAAEPAMRSSCRRETGAVVPWSISSSFSCALAV